MVANNAEQIEIQYSGDISFGIIDDYESLPFAQLKALHALIIKKSDALLTYKAVVSLKNSDEMAIYLKPLFIFGNIDELDTLTKSLIDGDITSMGQITYLVDEVNYIREGLKDFQ